MTTNRTVGRSPFIAVVYKDVDEGEVAYQFQMTVLSEDIRG